MKPCFSQELREVRENGDEGKRRIISVLARTSESRGGDLTGLFVFVRTSFLDINVKGVGRLLPISTYITADSVLCMCVSVCVCVCVCVCVYGNESR